MKNKKKMHYVSIFWEICKKAKLTYIFAIFIVLYFAFTVAIFYLDREAFNNFGDALWFTFMSFFTVGYGDFTVTTPRSRVFTVILIIYGAVIIAMFTAVWVNMITTIAKAKVFNEQDEIYDKLCNLNDLPHDELKKISEFFKSKRKKNYLKNNDNVHTDV